MRSRTGGFMLIEAMIGTVLFLVGILGMVSLQAAAAKNTVESKYRTDAAFLANQVIGQMWGDRANLAGYDTSLSVGTTARDCWLRHLGASMPGIADVSGMACGPAAAAVLGGAIPPSITIAATQATIVIRWKMPGDANNPIRSYQVVAQLNAS